MQTRDNTQICFQAGSKGEVNAIKTLFAKNAI